MTRSTCPSCLELVNARIESEDNKIFFRKFCPRHGESEALVSDDAAYSLRCRDYAAPGSIPLRVANQLEHGCPDDCGLCPSHQQHTCHPIVEVTEACDLRCPICIAGRRHDGFLAPEQFSGIVRNLIASEGRLENLTLSGGEPTLHPDFWELIRLAGQPEIQRVSVATNGLRLAEDRDFCRRLAESNMYVLLQWDGFDDEVYLRLRGRPLWDVKQRALDNLSAAGVPAQLIFVAARGINDHQLGRAVELLLGRDHVLSLAVQPLAMPVGAQDREFYASHRITVPGVIHAFEEQTDGLLRVEDFFPLPCPNPECVSLTYLLRLDDGSHVPFPRFVDMRKHLGAFRQSATLEPTGELEDSLHEVINTLWSTGGEIPDSARITAALRRALGEIFRAPGHDVKHAMRAAERQAKSIFIHHYMDPDTFDLSRVIKCCHHYPRPNGQIMPICAFNHFHRAKERNPFVA
jgi:uncharacterized radical SAM superfamily Fe-S cluster-containing enzyme